MKAYVLAAALSAIALSACTGYRADGGGSRERSLDCQVGSPRVSVTVDEQARKIKVDPKKICVTTRNAPIVWTIINSPAKYVFADDGVVIDATDGEFENCIVGNKGTKGDNGHAMVCLDLNRKHGASPARYYDYTVKVITTDGSPAPTDVDPVIMND